MSVPGRPLEPAECRVRFPGRVVKALPYAQKGNALSAQPVPIESQLQRLPLVTLYLTERCNSRCVTCDYWRHGRADMDLASVARLLPDLARLETRVVLISGGEPLLNAAWEDIARLLRTNGLSLWLLTSGLSLAKHARRAAGLFEAITVSLDGTDRETYEAIRGLDAFDKVCEGIRAAAAAGAALGVRVTVQRANYRQLVRFVALARQLGARQVSFVAVDVANSHAFARADGFAADLALQPEDLPVFERTLADLERECAADFLSGLIAESPRKLRRMQQYFTALCGLGPFPPVRCNVFDYSAVIGATGRVSPCFFIPGPPQAAASSGLAHVLNGEPLVALRERIRSGGRPECTRCVCSLWREPAERATTDFLLQRRSACSV
jgi:Fe-coproporphyrin III synthase